MDKMYTSRYLTFFGGNLVIWISKKQKVVSLSTTKVEYCAPHHAITELSLLKILLSELGYGLNGSILR